MIVGSLLADLEARAKAGEVDAIRGLKELDLLREMHDKKQVNLVFKEERSYRYGKTPDLDGIVRDVALTEHGILFTRDAVQAQVARIMGVGVRYLPPEQDMEVKWIDDYFDDDVMSVHLRAGTRPRVKRGTPGNMCIQELCEEISGEIELRLLGSEIIERCHSSSEGFLELERGGSTVVQLENMRIVIAQPPFADGYEITAARPVARIPLDQYRLSDQMKERVVEKKRGIILAGPPGAGKSTLAQSIAEYLLENQRIVKTMEKPRDLQVPHEITQYTDLDGSFENTAEVLLLVRPDYTIFDEVRKTPDFNVFADMRLAGVGMVGVTHANRGIDAIQRLLSRVELGMVPQVVDTVIFVDAGEIAQVYDISFTVKVPFGMTEQDLARPVIEVKDFEKGVAEYEIYSYGEQVVVMPVKDTMEGQEPLWELAARFIEEDMGQYVRGRVVCQVDSSHGVTVYVPDHQIPVVLGSGGERIRGFEDSYGVRIDVRPSVDRKKRQGPRSIELVEEGNRVVLQAYGKSGEEVDIHVDGAYLTTATVGSDGTLKMRKSTPAGTALLKALKGSCDITLR